MIFNYTQFNDEIAEKYGLKEAVLASFLWDLMLRDDEAVYRYGKMWTRISQRGISMHLPYMSERVISRAARKLKDKGILAIEKINDSKFDHTYSYAFTEFGCDLMIDEGCLF